MLGGQSMNNNQPLHGFSMEQAMAFVSTPAGQRLLAILREKNSNDLSKAQAYAASGEMDKAKDVISSLLKDPQILSILKQLGG
jgi:hypothetical protein